MNARSTRAKHARRLPFAVVVTTLVLGGLALLLALNTAAAANELRRHALASRDQAIAARVEQLRNEIAASAAPGSLASAAAAFGMVPAGNPAFIVDVNGHLVVRGRPLPVPEPVNPAPRHSAARKTTAPKKPAKTSARASKTTQPAPTTTSTAATSTSTSAKPGQHTGRTSPTPPSSVAPSPSPTPTPTPTVTLPGGPR